MLLFACLIGRAQETGVPLIMNYSPEEFGAEPQVWAVTQDNRGIMYFGASDGVLEYDGSTWKKIYTPKKQTVRSLDVDASGTIYVGAVNDFGYLKPDSSGLMVYVSLSAGLDTSCNNFEDVWKTFVGKDGVYFSANSFLFRYDPKEKKSEKITVYRTESGFFLLFRHKNEIYTIQRGRGLYKVGKDSLELAQWGEKVRTWFMEPYGEKILVGTGGLFVYDPDATKEEDVLTKKYFDEKAIAETDAFLAENQLYHAIALRDGRYALATIRSGIIIIDETGRIVQHVYKDNGLQSQTVHFLFQDGRGGLWAALTYGISRLEIQNPISTWDERSGLVGSIYNVIRYKGQIYASSNLGLHYFENNYFYPVPEIAGKNAIQVFDLKTYKIGGQLKFLATATDGIWDVEGRNAANISRLVSFGLYQSPFDSNMIFVPDGNNLYQLRYASGKWTESTSLAEFSDSPGSLFQTSSNEVWCIVGEKPVLLKISDNNGSVKVTPEFFDEKKHNEIKDIEFNLITKPDNDLLFMTNKGVFIYDAKAGKFILKKDLFGGVLSAINYDYSDIFKIKDCYVAVVKKNNRQHLIFLEKKGGNWQVDSSSHRRLRDIETYYNDGDSLLWFVSSKTLYKYVPGLPVSKEQQRYSLIRNVSLRNDSVIFGGVFVSDSNGVLRTIPEQDPWQVPVIPYELNDMVFYFSVPEFDNENYNEYSYFLEGDRRQREWSPWSSENKKEFTNLREGEYTFKVKARNIYGIETGESSYSFEILSPWYRTLWAWIVYIILGLALLWLIIKLYVRRLEQAKIRLEQIVKERTAEIMEQKEEILQQKEEITVQAEQLEATNKELEKLSLVARETDNAVLITDAECNIEWINQGFTRLYGYTLHELISVKGKNILVNSSNKNIKAQVDELIRTKKSCQYESLIESKSGKKIWSHTTLTPIFDDDGGFIKIVAIDSDISIIKQAEEEIMQQKEEIRSQRDEIESQRNMALSQRDEMVKQKKEITDSIRYALQIQNSMLPPKSVFNELVAGHFVFYKPRDIVSGDFYWIAKVEEKVVVSVADCTGHGVPGAFMSLLGMTFLKEIVVKEYITHPGVVLNRLRKEVIRSFNIQGTGFEMKDGMDISLCTFDITTKQLEFSGAYNSAIIMRKKEMIELKADRMPIGRYETMQRFSIQTLDIQEGDILYLYSDGYRDQFGGEKGRKLMSGKFRELIKEISSLPFDEQYKKVDDTFMDWKVHHEQVDDITIVGVKFI